MEDKTRQKIRHFRQNREGKVLAHNFAYLTLLQIASYLFPLITMPYLARVLGTDGIGKIAFAFAIIMWVLTIADWGFNYTGTRAVAVCRDNQKLVSRIFSTILWARMILALASLILLIVLIEIIPSFHNNALIILLTFLMVPGHILFPDWFFQALERMKYITWFNIILKSIFTMAVFIFIKDAGDYFLQPLIISSGYVIIGICSLYIITCKWGYKIQRIPLQEIWKTINDSSNVFINNLMPNLYNSFSTILMGMLGSSAQVGILDAGKKFMTLVNQGLTTISRTFFPYLSRKTEKHHIYACGSLFVSILAFGLLQIFAPLLIRIFYGAEFTEAVLVLRITAFAVPFFNVVEIYGTNYLLVTKHDKIMRNITLTGSLIGFVIAYPLIYYYNYIGAALTYTVSTGILATLSFIYAKKIEHKSSSEI